MINIIAEKVNKNVDATYAVSVVVDVEMARKLQLHDPVEVVLKGKVVQIKDEGGESMFKAHAKRKVAVVEVEYRRALVRSENVFSNLAKDDDEDSTVEE